MSMDFLPLILIFLLYIYNGGKHLTSDINKDKCSSIRTPVLVCVLFEFQFFYFLICAASSGRSGENPYCFISSIVFNARYSVGIMISVSISSPKTHTFPVILSMFQYPHIFDYFMSSARAISPAMAEAVTVAAEPKYTLELGCPARPLKFLVPVLIRTSFSPITP